MPDDTHYLWFRFFDANTNQTIQHVSFLLTITKQDHLLFRELLHTHTGILNVKVISTAGPTWNVTAAHEPFLNGWVPYSDDKPIVVRAPLFNDDNSAYHLNIQMFSMDNDHYIFDNTDYPSSVPNFNFLLDMKEQNQTISIIGSAPPLPIATGSIKLVTNSSPIRRYLLIGEPVFMQTLAENSSPQPQNFTYITEVFDNRGLVDGIQWYDYHLDPLQNTTLSNSWDPYRAGDYTIEAFVWSNLTDYAVPLANVIHTSIEVR